LHLSIIEQKYGGQCTNNLHVRHIFQVRPPPTSCIDRILRTKKKEAFCASFLKSYRLFSDFYVYGSSVCTNSEFEFFLAFRSNNMNSAGNTEIEWVKEPEDVDNLIGRICADS